MRTTSSFEVFPNEPSERELARARWLRREGKLDDAESAYRQVLGTHPALRTGWTECFELLRSRGKTDEALALAAEAENLFTTEAFPMALKGAALIELGRFKDALKALESAVGRDPDLALTWHELGYAAYRLGDGNRALLALDRAFALEPHTETLVLRGRILRDAGESYAAEVAFEAALHTAEHDGQRSGIEHEIKVTRRQGAFTPRWIQELSRGQEYFIEHGTIVLANDLADQPPSETDLVDGLIRLVHDRGWQFGQVLSPDPPDRWAEFARALGHAVEPVTAVVPDRVPLLVAHRVPDGDQAWEKARAAIRTAGRGAVVVLYRSATEAATTDVVGALEEDGRVLPASLDPDHAVVMAQHPGAEIADRILRPSPTTAGSV